MFQLEVAYPGLQRGRYIKPFRPDTKSVRVCGGGGDGGAVRSASNLIPTVGAVCVCVCGGGGGGGFRPDSNSGKGSRPGAGHG